MILGIGVLAGPIVGWEPLEGGGLGGEAAGLPLGLLLLLEPLTPPRRVPGGVVHVGHGRGEGPAWVGAGLGRAERWRGKVEEEISMAGQS